MRDSSGSDTQGPGSSVARFGDPGIGSTGEYLVGSDSTENPASGLRFRAEPTGVWDLVLLATDTTNRIISDMPRPANKADLLDAAGLEFERLWNVVDTVPHADRETPGACGEWSVKDLLAHLHAWHQMALRWEEEGSRGEKPAIPADGFTFAETPALNQAIYERHRNDAWGEVVLGLKRTHEALLTDIGSYGDEDLFTKKRFPWTRSTSVGAYMVSATSSHYAWASKLIRTYVKSLGSEPSSG